MHSLSYTISPNLQTTLKRIESERVKILLHPLSQASEIELRFSANIQRIYFSLHLSHTMVNQREITRTLTNPGRKLLSHQANEVLNYKHGLDYITREWLVQEKPIMPHDIHKLYRTVTDEKLQVSENELMEILVFLQTSREHNLIQGFVAYIQFTLMIQEGNVSAGKVARLLPYIFLYKTGLDFRGLLIVEEYFYQNEKLVRELKEAALRKESVTVWVEHFVGSITTQLEKIVDDLTQMDKSDEKTKSWNLTERQKEILTGFDTPGIRITNKKVQQLFRISQITASRDLARLASLGFLFQYGKGRSVYYMRA